MYKILSAAATCTMYCVFSMKSFKPIEGMWFTFKFREVYVDVILAKDNQNQVTLNSWLHLCPESTVHHDELLIVILGLNSSHSFGFLADDTIWTPFVKFHPHTSLHSEENRILRLGGVSSKIFFLALSSLNGREETIDLHFVWHHDPVKHLDVSRIYAVHKISNRNVKFNFTLCCGI